MPVLVFAAALFSAFCNAASSYLQRKATASIPVGRLFSKQFHVALIRHKGWMAGFGLQVLSSVGGLIALKFGPLSLVEPLLTVDLLFLLLILQVFSHLRPGKREWSAAILMCMGMSGFFLEAAPTGGHAKFTVLPWLLMGSVSAFIILICVSIIRSSESERKRAAAGGLAAGIGFALNSAVAKLTLNQLNGHGIGYLFLHWPLYAFIVTGAAALILMQSSHATGPLVVSQPIGETVEPSVSIAIGVLIFGESLHHSIQALAIETFCAAILLTGIVLLASSRRLQLVKNYKT